MKRMLMMFAAVPILGIGTCLGGCNIDGKGNWKVTQGSHFGISFEEDEKGDGQPASTNVTPFTDAIGSVAELWEEDEPTTPVPEVTPGNGGD